MAKQVVTADYEHIRRMEAYLFGEAMTPNPADPDEENWLVEESWVAGGEHDRGEHLTRFGGRSCTACLKARSRVELHHKRPAPDETHRCEPEHLVFLYDHLICCECLREWLVAAGSLVRGRQMELVYPGGRPLGGHAVTFAYLRGIRLRPARTH